MSFNYHKHKHQGNNESFWTSYSDLFLGLSSIFLLLYVTASLRTGTDGIRAQAENQKLTMKVQDLENQLKMYESIKQNYIEKQATKTEQQEYVELMDKLELLKEEAKDENEKLRQQALANDAKQTALNKYQQMVRNMINANSLAKTKITNREDVITEQDETLATKDQQLKTLNKDIAAKQKQIAEVEKKIADANMAMEKQMLDLKKAKERNKISAKLYQQKMAKLQEENENRIDALRDANEAYQQQLNDTQAKVGALSGKLAETEGKVGALSGKLAETEGRASALGGQLAATKGALAAKEGETQSLKGELAKAKAEMDARGAIAREIKKGFAGLGIKADIDMKTGDVLIDFGDHYFDLDSDRLKPQMKDILEKAMPVYSKSLFGNPKVANQISSVEVIGFASPIYKGRFVDPNSSNPEDKEALKYNMDLSYRRAKSIFSYVLDDKRMEFEYQPKLLPLMKVSGRSFLEAFKGDRSAASSTDFCKVNDCKKAQRVIIRFSMDGKK